MDRRELFKVGAAIVIGATVPIAVKAVDVNLSDKRLRWSTVLETKKGRFIWGGCSREINSRYMLESIPQLGMNIEDIEYTLEECYYPLGKTIASFDTTEKTKRTITDSICHRS